MKRIAVSALLAALACAAMAQETPGLSRGQTIYVPVYSDVVDLQSLRPLSFSTVGRPIQAPD